MNFRSLFETARFAATVPRVVARLSVAMPLALVLGLPFGAQAQNAAAQATPIDHSLDVEAHWQATYIWQRKPAFAAAYTGPNSLLPKAEKSYTFSGTGFFGARLWRGAEVYVDPEVIQGVAMSGLVGLASPTNGEIQKVAGPTPKAYLPRVFLRQTWGLGGETEQVESAVHQLAGSRDHDRVVVSVGKMAVTDIFDNNRYSHDARTQFLTWASLAHGPYDYVADAQGYTWGGAVELYKGDWAFRVGRFAGPKESNGEALNLRINRFYGDQFELEHQHEIGGQPGAVRLLYWRNRENMGRFDDAIGYVRLNGGTPDVGTVRRANGKRGWGVHVEQAFTSEVGGFVRYGWADGQTETYSFEEVERSTQVGLSLKGALWGRAEDAAGLLAIRNGLSAAHRAYLSQGGLGFFIGDGRLNYRSEQIHEGYYNIALKKSLWLGLDYQHIANPAYNADRGPVKVYGLRLHAEY